MTGAVDATPTKRSCMFCGALGPLTREHVVPLWLQKHVGGEETGSFRGTHVSWIGTKLSERSASGQSHTLGTVCASCNNGWMSQLESSFQALLPRLQAGLTPRQFSKSERRTIAMWVVKTGLVAHRSSNYRTILPPTVALALLRGGSIPAGIKVFGGKLKGGKTVRWVQTNVSVCRLRHTDVATFDAATQTFVFILAITNFFIGFGWHALSVDEFEIFHLDDLNHQIYPHPKAARSPRLLDDLTEAATVVGLRRRT